MKKIYSIQNLDCANCAAKIEAKFNGHPQVQEAVITFATKQLRLTAEDPDALIPELTVLARTVEPDVWLLSREVHKNREEHHDHKDCSCGHHHHHDHEECTCGHHHHNHEDCACGHHHHDHGDCNCGHHHDHEDCGCSHAHDDRDHSHAHHHDHGEEGESIRPLILGAAVFALGLGLGAAGWPLGNFLLCLMAYILLGREVIAAAVKNLVKGHVFDENFLMSLATVGAFCIGEFPEAVGIMLFYRVGEFFEHRAVSRSRSQIMEAVDLRPEVVSRLTGENVTQIPAEEAEIGDLLVLRPGDRIPLDGTVVKGESQIDTAPITGEPIPVRVMQGDTVISGCVNTSAALTIRVEKKLSESMVTRILNSVENAAASKPKIDRFITRFARVYTPVVVILAAATAVLPSLFTGDWGYWVYMALSFLVMSCPCALVLSVPLAFFAGIGTGSKKGILFKGGQSMEAMAAVKAVVLDKTGTLTRGVFRVQQLVGDQEMLRLCASCEQQSTHPIARSIVEYAREQEIPLSAPDRLEEISGQGIRAVVEGREILCGNARLLEQSGIALEPMAEASGTRVLVAVDGRFAGYLVIADAIKEGAAEAIAALHSQGRTTVMLTGDEENTAHAVAKTLGIPQVHAKLLPQEKLEKLQHIRREQGAVMFVGDGINDAPVLAGADVGAAMGSGADAAIEAADVVFMTSQVGAVAEALEIAGRTKQIAWQNVVFALAVKLAVMVLGLLGHANMWLAVFADSGVAMLCVLNSIRLLYRKG